MLKTIKYNDDNEIRLDVFLTSTLLLTRSQIKKLIDNNLVTVNGKNKKAGYLLQLKDEIVVDEAEKQQLNAKPENIELDIVYEDEDMLVINKPQGMVVHTAAGNYSGTLVNALAYKFKNLSDVNGVFRQGIVHRLDKDTSGLLLVAKNNFAHNSLAKQIAEKTCKRFYIAVLEGKLGNNSGVIETHIARGEINRKRMEVCDRFKGKLAITNYRVINYLSGYTVVEFELKTGRTHQIRVHSKHIGHPVVGDMLYGFKRNLNLKGQLLCAYKIEFVHPRTNELLSFSCNLPNYMQEFIKNHWSMICKWLLNVVKFCREVKMKNELKIKQFLNLLAWIAVLFAAVALALDYFFNIQGGLISRIASGLAYIIASIDAYYFVRTKRNVVFLILYIVAVVLVAVFLILPLFK